MGFFQIKPAHTEFAPCKKSRSAVLRINRQVGLVHRKIVTVETRLQNRKIVMRYGDKAPRPHAQGDCFFIPVFPLVIPVHIRIDRPERHGQIRVIAKTLKRSAYKPVAVVKAVYLVIHPTQITDRFPVIRINQEKLLQVCYRCFIKVKVTRGVSQPLQQIRLKRHQPFSYPVFVPCQAVKRTAEIKITQRQRETHILGVFIPAFPVQFYGPFPIFGIFGFGGAVEQFFRTGHVAVIGQRHVRLSPSIHAYKEKNQKKEGNKFPGDINVFKHKGKGRQETGEYPAP